MINFILENFDTIFKNKTSLETLDKVILDLAIKGKLVEQNQDDEPASELIKRIKAEKQRLIDEKVIKKEKPLPPIEDEEIPFDIPNNWESVKISEVAFVTKLAGFEYTKYIAPNLLKAGIPLFKGKNVQNGKLILEFESYISEKLSDELLRSQINKKCLLTPYVGTIGNIAIFEGNFKAHLGSNVGKIELFNNFENKILEEYVLIYFKSGYGISQLKKHKKATAQESISIEAIRDCIFLLPPIEEQKRIVSKVEKLQSIIKDLKEIYIKNQSNRENLKKSLLSEIESQSSDKDLLKSLETVFNNFDKIIKTKEDIKDIRNLILSLAIKGKLVEQNQDDEKASELLKRIKSEKQRLIDEKVIKKEKPLPPIEDEEIPFDTPNSWEWVRLGEISQYIQRGRSPEYSEIEEIPVVSQKCVQWTGFDITKARYINPASLEKYAEERFLKEKDLLWNSTGDGTLGRIAIYKKDKFEKVVADSHVTIIRTLNTENLYLLLYFSSKKVQDEINLKATGSTKQTELATSTVKEYIVPLPPIEEQKRIVSKVESLMKICDLLEEKITLNEKISENLFYLL